MGKRILIKNARAIVTCDVADQVFYDTDMLIEGPQIIQMGKNLPSQDAEVIDGRDKFIYPGLINTHHHFFQTFVRNLMTIDYPNMLVVEWLDKIYRIFQKIDSDVIYYSSLTAMGDLLKHGCTCAFDHQYCYTRTSGKLLVDRQMEAAVQLGIRYHAGRGTNTLPRSKGSTIPDNMLETTDEFISDCERLIDLYHDPAPFSMHQIVVAPCQPINSYIETFKESVALARTKGVRLHTHLGEGENNIMQERWGKRTLEWCEEIGFIGPDVWIAHGWELQPDEYKVMGQNGTGVSHCPAPAVLGGFPILDMKALQKENVIISLGCDGSATNDSSSLLDSLRMAYLMQAYHSKARGGCLSPYELLKVATVNGAKTLGREKLGSLEVGNAADLFMINTGVLELTGTLHDPKNILARAGVTGPVWLTMVNGKVVFRDGQLLGVDEQALSEQGEKVCTRVLRNECEAFR
ncbi:amidohydrolase [Desulfosporosinus fructosivorans]|uniref:Amidohydrolase n=1 Tax=Desulfosporosinus fructosivorans TaxID=2018669 RepID=A0A4Z0RB57_9FIRM|nr:amidohydrolase family protein [Desulfosporosinus fructosivorans]TGE39233.1 amidohydrolase [Desulfosporosinus fructosivorans]